MGEPFRRRGSIPLREPWTCFGRSRLFRSRSERFYRWPDVERRKPRPPNADRNDEGARTQICNPDVFLRGNGRFHHTDGACPEISRSDSGTAKRICADFWRPLCSVYELGSVSQGTCRACSAPCGRPLNPVVDCHLLREANALVETSHRRSPPISGRVVGYSEVTQFDGLSAFRPCERDLQGEVWAFYVKLACPCRHRMLADFAGVISHMRVSGRFRV